MSNNSNRRGRRSRRRGADDPSLSSLYFSCRSGRRGRSSVPDTKSLQLCRQIQQRLDLTLGELDDPLLQGLWVRAVLPEPGGRSVLVEVVAAGEASVTTILERLDAARGHLRHEVTAAIHRKRTPHLQFMVVPEAIPERSEDER